MLLIVRFIYYLCSINIHYMRNNRLAELLKEHRITQKKFAEMVNCTPQYINSICTGRLTASLSQFNKFADALGVPVVTLIAEPQDKPVFYCPHCGKPIRAVAEKKEAE